MWHPSPDVDEKPETTTVVVVVNGVTVKRETIKVPLPKKRSPRWRWWSSTPNERLINR